MENIENNWSHCELLEPDEGQLSSPVLRGERDLGNFSQEDNSDSDLPDITQGKVYFLSRPRRFGKSLLISTLRDIFSGKRDLFQNLWINQSDYDWEQYPVIWLDMSLVENSSAELLQQSLHEQLDKVAKRYGIELAPSVSVAGRLDNLIIQLAEGNKKVVVLIDEYDSPLIDQILSPKIAIKNRDVLKKFYSVLKAQDTNLRFVFLTGVTKFSKVSIFSGLNNLEDISLLPDYATLLGYTQQELTDYFSPEIDSLAQKERLSRPALLDQIKLWYNGYRFSEKAISVYNPFSSLLLFKHQRFATHWFSTGTPTFLIKLIQEEEYDITGVANLKIDEEAFSAYEIDDLDIEPLLYQTGYLTIKAYHPESRHYELGYPNQEVEMAFLNSLLNHFSKVRRSVQSDRLLSMKESLEKQDFDAFFQHFQSFLAKIPYELHIPVEKYYQNIFYFVFTLVGLDLSAEVHTNRGRMDTLIEGKDYVLIFELKINKYAQEALQQIKEKGYAEQYMTQKKAVYLIGINFDTEKRNVSGYLVEKFI